MKNVSSVLHAQYICSKFKISYRLYIVLLVGKWKETCTVHIVTVARKYFQQIFLRFWSICFRISKKSESNNTWKTHMLSLQNGTLLNLIDLQNNSVVSTITLEANILQPSGFNSQPWYSLYSKTQSQVVWVDLVINIVCFKTMTFLQETQISLGFWNIR